MHYIFNIILYYVILHYIILYIFFLYCITLYYMILDYIILRLIINPVLLRPNMNRIKPWGCCLLFEASKPRRLAIGDRQNQFDRWTELITSLLYESIGESGIQIKHIQTSEINGILSDDVWNPTYFFFPHWQSLIFS